MKSLTTKTAAIAGAVLAAGLGLYSGISHQIQVENEAANADVLEITNRAKSYLKELDERNQGNPDYPH